MAPRRTKKAVGDYDKDGAPNTANDKRLAKRDLNKDGTVTAREETRYQKRQEKPQVSTTTARYDAQGRVVSSKTVTPLARQEEKKPRTAADYGVSRTFLEKYPDMVSFIQDAIDNDYDNARFFAEIENTTFGKERTQAQEAFDIAIDGPQSEDLLKKVNDRVSQLRQDFTAAGIQISDQDLQRYGREVVRSDLSNQDVLAFMASQFSMPSTGQAGLTGASSQIYQSLIDMAREYGLTMSDDTLKSKVRTGLEQGGSWQSWVEGQRNIFREQAKLQYPTLGDRLNEYSVEQLLEPYMNDAAEILGLSKQQMSVMDPVWQRALNGVNGPLSRDEWIRTLRTDPKYGFDRTVKARQEYSYLADELLSAFGMA